jgi:Flp pilus assembly protein TadB
MGQWVFVASKYVAVLAAGLVLALFIRLRRHYQPSKVLLHRFRELSGFVKRRASGAGWYKSRDQYLKKMGAAFHLGPWINPLRYLSMKIVLAALGFGVVATFYPAGGVASACALYFLPDMLLGYLNGKDNEKLLPELKLVYHALEIQIRAGVYVTDALAECYGSVCHRRLKAALLDLASDVVMKANLHLALEKFQAAFDNRYIDTLCLIILQALESGQAVELLEDIGEQMKDMESRVMERKKQALDRSVTFYQLVILGAVLGVALYAGVTYMMNAAGKF